MFVLGKLNEKPLEKVLAKARSNPLSYHEIGQSTEDHLPNGYYHIEVRTQVGDGSDFDRAKAGLKSWAVQHGAGAKVFPDIEVSQDATILVILGLFPVYFIAPCRVVRIVDTPDRYGFAYGTIVGHLESGEELFLVERSGDRTYFLVRAFSRPGNVLVRLTGPISRAVQKYFTRRYVRAMINLVSRDGL